MSYSHREPLNMLARIRNWKLLEIQLDILDEWKAPRIFQVV